MVSKIADLSAIHPRYSKGRESTKISENSSDLFRLGNFKEISVIKQTTEVQQMVTQGNYQESYGLDTIKPKQSRAKKVNKLGIRSIDRLGTDEVKQHPETPSPHMGHKFDYL